MSIDNSEKHQQFRRELNIWMNNDLSPYCLNKCQNSCCDCNGAVKIDKGYEHLFKTNKTTGAKIPIKNREDRGPRLFKLKEDKSWYYEGGACPNYEKATKKCLIRGQHPMCTLYPLIRTKTGYTLFSTCELHGMEWTKEPLKSLAKLCKKHGIKLEKEKM